MFILNDRKQEFVNNNLSLCENGCNYTGYDQDMKQSSCNCSIKNKMDLISDIVNNPNKLSNNFNSDNGGSSSSSIVTIKCTKNLFSKEGLKNNISSYILIIFIFTFLLCLVLFLKCGYPLLNNDINDIIKEKEKIEKKNKNRNQITTISKNYRRKNTKRKTTKKSFPPKKYKVKLVNNLKINRNINVNFVKPNENSNNINNFKYKINSAKIKKNIISNKTKLFFNSYELNTFDYRNALLYDKRTCFQYYCDLLRTKNIILFSFCPIKDYNSIFIKICIFTLSFSIHYAINFAFFDDDMLHKIYETGGLYDFIYFIPKICTLKI